MRFQDVLAAAVVVAIVLMAAWGDVIEAAIAGAFDHARAQAGAEVRRTRQAILDNAREGLRRHLQEGAGSSPLRSGWWWAAAGVRSAAAVRRGMRGLRRGASGLRARSLPSAGPLRRVFDAAVAGGRAGAQRARENRRDRRARRPGLRDRLRQGARDAAGWGQAWHRAADGMGAPSGVCDDCGAVCYRTALQPVIRPGPGGNETWLLCPVCRATPATAPGNPEDQDAVPALASTPPLALMPAGTTVNTNGAPMSGAVERRTAAVSHGGDITTHGDWDRLTRQVAEALAVTTQCQEAMLGDLRTADAGRSQVAAIGDWSDQVGATVKFTENMLENVNARIGPLIDAVSAGRGPAEVASPAYHSDY